MRLYVRRNFRAIKSGREGATRSHITKRKLTALQNCPLFPAVDIFYRASSLLARKSASSSRFLCLLSAVSDTVHSSGPVCAEDHNQSLFSGDPSEPNPLHAVPYRRISVTCCSS